MKVLMINGSPRLEGNTCIASDARTSVNNQCLHSCSPDFFVYLLYIHFCYAFPVMYYLLCISIIPLQGSPENLCNILL